MSNTATACPPTILSGQVSCDSSTTTVTVFIPNEEVPIPTLGQYALIALMLLLALLGGCGGGIPAGGDADGDNITNADEGFATDENEDGDQFPSDQEVVQRDEGGARPGHREKGLQVEDGVLREDRDTVPPADPTGTENGGVASDPVAQFPVGHFLLCRDEREPGGMGAGVVLEDVLDEQGIPPVLVG